LLSLQAHGGLLAILSCVSSVKSLLWFEPEPTMTALFGVVHPVGGVVMEMQFLLSVCQLWCGSLLKARKGTSCCLSRGGSMLVAGFKRLAELGKRGWLCGAQQRSLVCLGTVKPFVYAGGTPMPWRRLAVRGLFDHTPDAGGVVALCGLGCVLPLDYVDDCRVVVSLRVALRPHPRCR
jgi:hypothetical protein